MLYEVELTGEYRVRGTDIVPEPPLPGEGEHDHATLAIASNALGEHVRLDRYPQVAAPIDFNLRFLFPPQLGRL